MLVPLYLGIHAIVYGSKRGYLVALKRRADGRWFVRKNGPIDQPRLVEVGTIDELYMRVATHPDLFYFHPNPDSAFASAKSHERAQHQSTGQ